MVGLGGGGESAQSNCTEKKTCWEGRGKHYLDPTIATMVNMVYLELMGERDLKSASLIKVCKKEPVKISLKPKLSNRTNSGALKKCFKPSTCNPNQSDIWSLLPLKPTSLLTELLQ